MNPAQLLAYFDRISEVPDAIPRLRRFILDLAVRGKLVEQDPSEGTGRGTLSDIKKLKEQMLLEKGIRGRQTVESSIRPKNLGLPSTWATVSVDDIGIVQGGKRLPAGATFSKVQTAHIYIRVTDMKNGTIIDDQLQYITPDVQRAISRYTINREDLYITIAGTIGQVGRVPSFFDGQNLTENAAKIVFRGMNPQYLCTALSSDLVQYQFKEKTNQVAQPKLALKRILGAQFPLPPLAEQHRIVAKVNELMALCDRLEVARAERESRRDRLAAASLHRLNQPADTGAPEVFREDARFYLNHLPRLTTRPEQIKQLRQTILNLAVRGQLVPQDPNDEPASDLLSAIEARKELLLREGKIRHTKACRSLGQNEAPHVVPASWSWTILGEITDVGTGSTPSRTQPSFWAGGSIPWVTSGSTSQDLITKGDEFVTEAAVKAHRLRLYPPGTLLVALYGQGKTRGQIATLGIESTINQACAAVCPLHGFEEVHGYLRLLFEKNYDEVRLLAAGGAQPNLNLQKIKEMAVPLPPLAEQSRIVAKVDELMSLCDQLESQIGTAQTESRLLLEAVLHEAITPAGLQTL